MNIQVKPDYEALLPKMPPEEYDALKQSIKTEGQEIPIIINKDGFILDGHHRYRACKELNIECRYEIKEFPSAKAEECFVIMINLLRRHLKQEDRYVMINKYANIRGVTMSLRAVAQELAIADKTVDRAIAYSHAVEEMPELKGKAVTWVIHEHQRRIDREERGKKLVGMPIPQNLIHGDALEELKKLPNESIDCIITDPPWGVGYSPHALEEVRNDNIRIFDYMPKITQEFYRILKKDADCYTFCGYGESFCSFYHAFISAHFIHSNTLIWIKDSRVKGLDFSHRYAHFYEPIIYMKKGNRFLNNSFSKDVLNFAKVEGGYASTEKPIELLSYLINNSTVKGEIVLDCFCGSGSTLVAAQQNERRWIGIDIEQKWIDISKQRIMELRKNEV